MPRREGRENTFSKVCCKTDKHTTSKRTRQTWMQVAAADSCIRLHVYTCYERPLEGPCLTLQTGSPHKMLFGGKKQSLSRSTGFPILHQFPLNAQSKPMTDTVIALSGKKEGSDSLKQRWQHTFYQPCHKTRHLNPLSSQLTLCMNHNGTCWCAVLTPQRRRCVQTVNWP